MKTYLKYIISLSLILAGSVMVYFGTLRPVQIYVNGNLQNLYTRANTVYTVLEEAAIKLAFEDRLAPPLEQKLGWKASIFIESASPFFLSYPSSPDIPSFSIVSAERFPGNLFLEAGIRLFPGDLILSNGQIISPDQPLRGKSVYSMQYYPAVDVQLLSGNLNTNIVSASSTLGLALAEMNVYTNTSDLLSTPLDTPLDRPISLLLQKARPVTIQVDGKTVAAQTAQSSVGGALADAGIALQGLDYSVPPENQLLPSNGSLKVVRVREEVILSQTPIAFKSETVSDPNVELDQRRVVEAGQYGLEVTRTRVRYEDGKEVSRKDEDKWVAAEPKSQKVGYGTKVVVHSLDTPAGTVQYWRAVQVYATSYSPCNSGADRCYPNTANGTPVKRGVIAVTLAWYRMMVGQGVYIPGYGSAVIADNGGGIPGRYWIDLGFTDADYESWHQTVTMYFLTPVPSFIPPILP
jgi:resuscitation-promoting factor RpfB